MHRVPDSERLTHRFAVNVTPEECRQIVDEAQQRNLPPTTVARMMLVEGLAIIRRKGIRARSMERSRKREAKGETV